MIADRESDSFVDNTMTVAAAASNPSYVAAVGIGKHVVKMLAERRQSNKDDIIGVLYTSLNRREHYPHGERKRDDVPDLTNNMFIDYSMFGFDPQPQYQPPIPQTHTARRLPPVGGTMADLQVLSRRSA